MNRTLGATLVASLVVFLSVCMVAAAIPPALTVTQITRDGVSVSSAPDIILRNLSGVTAKTGVQTGYVLPDNVRVEVPVRDTITMTAANGKSKATLEGGCAATFHFTGAVESIAVASGKATFDDPVGFFHVTGPHGIDTTSND